MSVDISLALHAVRQEGRTVRIVPWSWWREHAEPGRDYLVLQDDTYKEWSDAEAVEAVHARKRWRDAHT